jgi:hypothetical protein
MDRMCHLQATAKGQHFGETLIQFPDEICALRLCACFKLYKAEAYSLVDPAAVAGDIEVAKTGTHRKTEQRADKNHSRIVLAKELFHLDRVSDHGLFRRFHVELR